MSSRTTTTLVTFRNPSLMAGGTVDLPARIDEVLAVDKIILSANPAAKPRTATHLLCKGIAAFPGLRQAEPIVAI